MTVLFISRRFPPSTGGMEKFAKELYDSLTKKIDVKLIKWGGSSKYLPIVLPCFLLRAGWLLLTKKIDVIHMQDGLLSPLGVILKFIFRKPLVVVVHGLDVTYKNRLYQRVVTASLKRADKIISISTATTNEARRRLKDKNTVVTIPPGIHDVYFYNDKAKARRRLGSSLDINLDNKQILLTVGRLVERKGVVWFVAKVMPELVARYPKVVYLVPGEGPEREAIAKAIKKHHLNGAVKLVGRVDSQTLKDLYNAADIFVMPNIKVPGDMEGFGLVLLEASTCELPIVASGIEGIKDAITSGKNGVLLESASADQYLETISKYLNSPDEARKFGQISRVFTLENYQWNNIADKYLRHYKGG